MTPAPQELVDLRARTAASYRWRKDGKTVPQHVYDSMSNSQQGECRWTADPALLELLKAAETAFTATFPREAAHGQD